ncbi:MAG TPA: S9 family peptidase [Pseudomonadales bacterium]|nr:S9 family peptidase [Pseudomonadales bacterium]
MSNPVLDVHRLIALGRLNEQVLSPDGTWVAACVQMLDKDGAAYIGSLWRVPVDGSPAERLLEGAFDDKAPAFRPDGTLTFISNRTDDAHGPEDEPDTKARKQVWALGADGTIIRLTAEPLGVVAHAWARNADVHIVETPVLFDVAPEDMDERARDLEKGPSMLRYTSMPVRFWDSWLPDRIHHLVALLPDGRRDLTPDRTERFPEWSWAVSEDGTAVAMTGRIPGPARMHASTLQVVDVATGTTRMQLVDPNADCEQPHFSPDGGTLLASRAELVPGRVSHANLVLIPIDEPAAMRVLAEDWELEPHPLGWTRDGLRVLAAVAEQARTRLYALDVDTGSQTALTDTGTCHAVAVGENFLVLQHSSVLTPPRLRVLDPATGTGADMAPLDGLDVDLAEHVVVEEITVPGHGGDPVQSWMVSPRNGGNGRGLLWIHGGPIGSWGDVWQWRWCATLAALEGFVVALPNPRGSTGFGREFVQGIWNNTWGDACATDVLAVADALAERDDVDADRITAMGGSFGGYMTNWLGTQTDRFASLVTHASLYDFQAFHGATDIPSFWAWQFGLDPWNDRADLDRYNPRAYLNNWRTRTLILHGEKDYRVPIAEALALFEGLQARGVPSELCVFPDENHWILKPRNIVAWYDAWIDFVTRE